MSENLENKEMENIESRETMEQDKNIKTNSEEKKTKLKKVKARTVIVFLVLVIALLGALITYRADYLEALEIGSEYLETFMQTVKYKIYIGVSNFVIIFILVCITNRLIKKGLKKFFEEENKEIPKLPSKTLALIIALVTSIIVSNLFLQKVILFTNAAWFGMPDPIFDMDMGFYMFQMPLIRTTIILCCNHIYNFNNIHNCVLLNSI